MADEITDEQQAGPPSSDREGEYVVVARRYRPQTFEDLIGQEHVAKALSAAITGGRVGHAYLFTGARGVGKTSAARILAKALDCQQGASPTPCNDCDICQSISSGGDVDVLEIDGASNRGIEEIRQLRANVGIRPSRARFKIYIIDEVHMLTREAFNALLKTLEEPPEHVKFIFCTTEPTKIPVTVLSRCQRFDFAGIASNSIAARLADIVRREGLSAQPEALAILARRAAGSMRDSQSLLEQLLSFGGDTITVADVHAMLGTADNQRLLKIAGHIAASEPAAALAQLDAALAEGVDVGELLEQLLGILRDAMASLAGCGGDSLLSVATAEEQQEVSRLASGLSLERVLAMLQIVEETISRLRYSMHRRTLGEIALVRLCRLENLEELSALAASLATGASPPAPASPRPATSTPPPAAKKKLPESALTSANASLQAADETADAESPAGPHFAIPPAGVSPSRADSEMPEPAPAPLALTEDTVESLWAAALERLGPAVMAKARSYRRVSLSGPNRLEVAFPESYNFCKRFFDEPQRLAQLELALAEVSGGAVRVHVVICPDEPAAESAASVARPANPMQRLRAVHEHPLVRRAGELFGARPVDLD